MKSIIPTLLVLGAIASQLCAAPRNSANYAIGADIADGGGRRSTSASYTNDGSVGTIAGISTVASPSETVKSGYLGQLYDIVGFALSANPTTVDEGGTLQLESGHLLDDATMLAVPAPSVAWSVVLGQQFASINPTTGLLTAGNVYASIPTPVTAQGIYAGTTSTLVLSVVNVNLDDLPGYSGDGIDDAWQVQYFGVPPNANAGPLLDPDGDGQTNLFEYTAGLIPTDSASRFTLKIVPVPDPGNPGQFLSGQKNLIFNPLVLTGGRSYTVKFRTDLATGTWATLSGTTQSDTGSVRTVTDLNATGAQKFYHVEITKP